MKNTIRNLYLVLGDIRETAQITGLTEEEIKEALSDIETVSEEAFSEKIMRESQAVYDLNKVCYCLEDYLNLPDDRRAELIDGKFYDMATPAIAHQMIVGEIYALLREYIRRNRGKCKALVSPLSVQLDQDDFTVVEPDVMVICDQNKMKERVIYGAPDMVIEVLSPSTRRKDMNIKREKYENSGVREYWMVDPKNRKVIVYAYERKGIPEVYTWDEEVPVAIWDGRFAVDFRIVAAEVDGI